MGSFGYNRSLFSRLMKAGYPVIRLKTQYRMHPLIREFPSTAFYGGLLKDDVEIAKKTNRPWHKMACFGPLTFFDVRGCEKKVSGTTSIAEEYEAQCVIAVYLFLIAKYPQLMDSNQFGIVSPYKGQVKLIRQKLSEALGSVGIAQKRVDVNTLDGFQGREKDVIILSVCRSNKSKNIGFVADEHRFNVGLTRASSSMIVIGHVCSLSRYSTWQSLISFCINRKKLFRIPIPRSHDEHFAEYFRSQIERLSSFKN